MDLSEFDYRLPPGSIAQTPTPARDGARLLVVDRTTGKLQDRMFAELPDLLRPGDCVVVNDSRVIPARVLARETSGRDVELLFLEPESDGRWRALVRPGRRCRPGAELSVGGEGSVWLRVVAVASDGARVIEPLDGTITELLATHGRPPLPPYIAHHLTPSAEDFDRYQTVYAKTPGSVAAPTAGLHFSDRLLDRLRARGVEIQTVTLHVGPATFRPLRAGPLETLTLPAERVTVTPVAADAVNRARRKGRRIVAVGTTTSRALEGAARPDGCVTPLRGEVTLTIRPDHRFRVIDALVTNFHLPRSSLLVLVSAFAGRERVLGAYRHAIGAGYRFYSYGDATLFE